MNNSAAYLPEHLFQTFIIYAEYVSPMFDRVLDKLQYIMT